MTVSIIIPVYNVEKHLSACIDSILSQSFKDWELILIDDGSRDNSGKICDEYVDKDNRIHAFHYNNGGASEARNRGIKEAKGEYITFIDSDDIVNTEYLSNFSYNEFLDFEIQGFMLNYIGHEQDNKEIKPNSTKSAPIKDVYAESELNKLSRGPVCKLFKRSIIVANNIAYPKGIQFGEDAIFVKRYLSHCNGMARSIAKADYMYNHFPNEKSLTSRKHPGQMMYDVAKMDYELFELLEEKWGRMPKACRLDFKRNRTLEMYYSVCTYLTEKNHTLNEKVKFLSTFKSELYPKVKTTKVLPITYRIIKFAIEYTPLYISVILLQVVFKITKP